MAATQHYAIRPKSDLILLYGLANRLIANGWIDRDYIDRHTSGFEAFADFVAQFTADVVSDATGLRQEQLEKFAKDNPSREPRLVLVDDGCESRP